MRDSHVPVDNVAERAYGMNGRAHGMSPRDLLLTTCTDRVSHRVDVKDFRAQEATRHICAPKQPELFFTYLLLEVMKPWFVDVLLKFDKIVRLLNVSSISGTVSAGRRRF